MIMKSYNLLLLASVILAIAGCGSGDEENTQQPEVPKYPEANVDTLPQLTGKKWYFTKRDFIVFNEDGTNTYKSSCTFVHDRKNDRILFYKDGSLNDFVNIFELTDTTLSIGKSDFTTYTTKPPKQLCEKLEITYTGYRVTIKVGERVKIQKSVSPADADDQSVTLFSDNPEIVSVDGEYMIGVSPGTVGISATTNDGSNKQASCTATVVNDTYQVSGLTCPMIEEVDLGLPSGTRWADMNIGADAPFRMSSGFDRPIDVAPYVGSAWQYPTEEDFRELIENCDVKTESKNSDMYGSIRMGHPDYYPLTAAVFTSRVNGCELHLYAYTLWGNYCYLYPYCLADGSTYSITDHVKECALNPKYMDGNTSTLPDKVLIRLVKR